MFSKPLVVIQFLLNAYYLSSCLTEENCCRLVIPSLSCFSLLLRELWLQC